MLKVGDKVTRILGDRDHELEMELEITKLTEDKIICGDWEFCRHTGAEIDDLLGWGPPPCLGTGSFIVLEEEDD